MPWHIWKLLASIPSPTSPSLLQLFLVANSGKYPSVIDACRGRGRRRGVLTTVLGGGREVGRPQRVHVSHPEEPVSSSPALQTAGRVTRG